MDDLPPDLDSICVDQQDNASITAGLQLTLRETPNGKPIGWSEQIVTVLSEREGRSPDAAPISGVRTLPDEGIDLRAAVEEFESNLILQALAKTGNNKNKAAQLL